MGLGMSPDCESSKWPFFKGRDAGLGGHGPAFPGTRRFREQGVAVRFHSEANFKGLGGNWWTGNEGYSLNRIMTITLTDMTRKIVYTPEGGFTD